MSAADLISLSFFNIRTINSARSFTTLLIPPYNWIKPCFCLGFHRGSVISLRFKIVAVEIMSSSLRWLEMENFEIIEAVSCNSRLGGLYCGDLTNFFNLIPSIHEFDSSYPCVLRGRFERKDRFKSFSKNILAAKYP